MIYFDNAATTPLSPTVIESMVDVMKTNFGNPSSTHSHGREASRVLRQARERIARLIQTSPAHVLFTSGGTEGNNTVIKGYALAHQDKGKHIITTAIEHHAVLETVDYLVERFGFEATYIQPHEGKISAQQIAQALRPDTILVSTMFANNETGDLLPIQEIGQILQHHQAAYHVDAVQAIGKFPIAPEELGIDFLTASAHKFHGPKGIGFLYAKQFHFDNLLHGGSQENKHRASTENLTAIVGMATALEESLENWQEKTHHIEELRNHLLEQLGQTDFYLNQSETSLPHVVNIGFPHQANDLLLLRLDLVGISISTGSACTAGTVQPSHVLEAYYGPDSARLKESIRISFSEQNTLDEVTNFCQALQTILGGK